MRFWPIPILLMATGLTAPLQAQDPHFGIALNLAFPTGEFRNKTYPPTSTVNTTQTEGYDIGLGGQFTISFPVDPKVAIRMNFGGQTTDGTNTAPGEDTINLQHQMYSLGGEVQVFPGTGSAYRHQGTYVLGGVSADFERFDRSFGTPNVDFTATTRKSRMGGTIGVGHSFGYDAFGRFTLEGVFHKTLSGNRSSAGDPPSTDFVKLSCGWMF
jgi:hypothetical protein